ncbi:MAG: hypothetical protein LBB36_01675, partial [Fibromonadaceae bacterium]|nr:hypothetical protein [Fibromonadaceae bacterium]
MRKILFFVLVLFVAFAAAQQFPEKLDRGLVAVKNGNNAFLSWRLFAYDPDGVQFNVY